MSRFLSEIVLRRSFAYRRSCVESRFKLDYEKEQEEKLLLTIIPKHIAKEVSEDLREAIADVTIGDDSDFEDETNEVHSPTL